MAYAEPLCRGATETLLKIANTIRPAPCCGCCVDSTSQSHVCTGCASCTSCQGSLAMLTTTRSAAIQHSQFQPACSFWEGLGEFCLRLPGTKQPRNHLKYFELPCKCSQPQCSDANVSQMQGLTFRMAAWSIRSSSPLLWTLWPLSRQIVKATLGVKHAQNQWLRSVEFLFLRGLGESIWAFEC